MGECCVIYIFFRYQQKKVAWYICYKIFVLRYGTSGSDTASGSVSVTYGHDDLETLGRVLVIHDSTGARITCTVIAEESKFRLNYSMKPWEWKKNYY